VQTFSFLKSTFFKTAIVLSCLALTLGSGEAVAKSEATLDLATTTSVRDSGLLESLLPDFEKRTGINVRVIAVGTGAALRMGAEGNVDVLLTHAATAEQELVESGAVLARVPFMENFFVIAGPAEDPAGVRGAASAPDAYRRMVAAEVPYVSRADDSGTHKREVSLMRASGLEAEFKWPGFARTGTGMGFTLQVAGERRAYVLSDIATFLAYQKRIGLVVLSKDSADLRNVYALLRVDPEHFAERGAPINNEGALALELYLTSPDVQQQIAEFGRERFGRSLFKPLLSAEVSADVASDAPATE